MEHARTRLAADGARIFERRAREVAAEADAIAVEAIGAAAGDGARIDDAGGQAATLAAVERGALDEEAPVDAGDVARIGDVAPADRKRGGEGKSVSVR